MALDRNDPYSAIPQLEKELKGKMSAQGEVVKKLEGAIDGYKKITNTIKHTLTENSATIEAIKEDGEEFRNEIKQDLNGISTTVQRINNNYVTQTEVNQTANSVAISAVRGEMGKYFNFTSEGLEITNGTQGSAKVTITDSLVKVSKSQYEGAGITSSNAVMMYGNVACGACKVVQAEATITLKAGEASTNYWSMGNESVTGGVHWNPIGIVGVTNDNGTNIVLCAFWLDSTNGPAVKLKNVSSSSASATVRIRVLMYLG